MKRYISVILIPCLLLYFSACSSLTMISAEEVKQKLDTGSYYHEIFVITKNTHKYHFYNGGYQIKNDTLYAEGLKVFMYGEGPFKGKIAVQDILYFEVSEEDAGVNWCLIGFYVGLGLAFAYLFYGLSVARSFQ